jgi:hypothetical protein
MLVSASFAISKYAVMPYALASVLVRLDQEPGRR